MKGKGHIYILLSMREKEQENLILPTGSHAVVPCMVLIFDHASKSSGEFVKMADS